MLQVSVWKQSLARIIWVRKVCSPGRADGWQGIRTQKKNPGTGYFLGCCSWQGRDEDCCFSFLSLRMLVQISFHDVFKVQGKSVRKGCCLLKPSSFSFQRMMNLGMNIVMWLDHMRKRFITDISSMVLIWNALMAGKNQSFHFCKLQILSQSNKCCCN